MKSASLVLVLVIAGCASAVGWGKKYEIVQANQKQIMVRYDTMQVTPSAFAADVDAHCAKFGKSAVFGGVVDTQAESMWGAVKTIAYRCES